MVNIVPSDMIDPIRSSLHQLLMGAYSDSDLTNDLYGDAMCNYLLFREPTARRLLEQIGKVKTDHDVLYNAYYWGIVFYQRYRQTHGRDVGIEQQLFRLLENSTVDIDWEFIKEIDAMTGQDFV